MEHLPTDIPMNTNYSIPSVYSESLSYYEEITRFRYLLINAINGINALIDKEEQDVDDLNNRKEDKTFLTNNRKLSESGNFTGSWWGIDKPVHVEGGIDAVVIQQGNQINSINSNSLPFIDSLKLKFLFNAKLDGSDDSDALNSYYTYCTTHNERMTLPSGVIGVGKTLNFNLANYYNDIVGYQTEFRAVADLTTMVKLSGTSTPDNYYLRRKVRGIKFNGMHRVDNLVDAVNLHYSSLDDNEFYNVKSGGTALKYGGWCNTLNKNNFYETDPSYIKSWTAIEVSNVLNNFVVFDNMFTSMKYGIVVTEYGNDTHYIYNSFDNTGCPLVFKNGGHNIEIHGNYFENSGNINVDVPKSSSVTEQWMGCIVGFVNYSMISTYFFRNLLITGNQFANVCVGNAEKNIITISNLDGCTIEQNNVLENYTYNSMVKLMWEGSPYYRKGVTKISVNGVTGQFAKVIDYTTGGVALPSRNRCRIVVKDYLNRSYLTNNDIHGNLSTFTANGGITYTLDGDFEGVPVYKISNITASSYFMKTLTLDTSGRSTIQGRYFRVKGIYKGTTGLAQGIALTIKDQSGNVIYSNTNVYESWREFYDELIYIPSTVTTLSIITTGFSSGKDLWISGIEVVPASIDI